MIQVYKIIGSVDFLGSPTTLVGTIGEGVVSLFYEPARGIVHGPDDFVTGIATGMRSLVLNSVFALLTTTSSVTGSLSRGLEKMAPIVSAGTPRGPD